MRGLLLLGVPSLTVLSFVGLAAWRWLARKRINGGQRRQLDTASCASVSSPPPSGEQLTNNREDTYLAAESRTEVCHELPAHPILSSREPPASNGAGRSELLEALSKERKQHPLASSDIQSDTLSSLDSIVSSEDVPSLGPKSPATLPDSGNPSPSLDEVGGHKSVLFDSSAGPAKSFSSSRVPAESPFKSPASCGEPGSRVRVSIQIPRDLVGRFIGKQGKNIKALMADSTGAHVYVDQHSVPEGSAIVPCYIQGSGLQVNLALKIVSSKFPSIEMPKKWLESELPLPSPLPHIPASSPLSSLFSSPPQSQDSWKVELRPAFFPPSPFHAVVTYIESLSRVWLVPYESSSKLDELHQAMAYAYSYSSPNGGSPGSSRAEGGNNAGEELLGKFCAVKVSEVHGLRGRVLSPGEDRGSFEVRLVDYGSAVMVPRGSVKPLK